MIKDILQALKAARRISREEEIRLHGKPINYNKVEKNPRIYTRKQKHKTEIS